MRQLLAVMTVVLLTWNLAPAAEHPPAEHAEHSASASADAHAPAVNEAVLPPGGIRWPGPMLLIVIGLFLAAAVIGPLSRLEEPEPVAPAHDDPGHGHDHGGGGHH